MFLCDYMRVYVFFLPCFIVVVVVLFFSVVFSVCVCVCLNLGLMDMNSAGLSAISS
jgi:hypothetical protein